jgi:hypothetical protein
MGESVDPRENVCIVNGALFPTRFAVNAALDHLDRWVRDGVAPPTAPRYDFDGTGVARDADRNALGGLRLAPIEVPLARYESALCNLGGITIPFTPAELIQRYGDHQTYYDQVVDETAKDVTAGYILPTDAEELLARACAARPMFLDTSTEPCASSVDPAADPGTTPDGAPDDAADPSAAPGTGALPSTGGGAPAWAVLALAAAPAIWRRRQSTQSDCV